MRSIFQQIPWIYQRDPEELVQYYYKYGTEIRRKKGTVIKGGGDSQKHFYLLEGLCAYFINYAEGKPRSFALITPGCSMGDITCITGERVNVTTIVLRDSRILSVPPSVIVEAVKNPELSLKICRHVMHKQESSLEALFSNFNNEPSVRLKIFLRALLEYYTIEIGEWNEIPLIFTYEELAMLTGTTRVTVNRLLSGWKKDGLIRKNGKQVIARKSLFDGIYDWLEHI